MNKTMTVCCFIMSFSFGSFSANAENTLVNIETSQGNIYVELFNEQAPETVNNFLSYVEDGFYEGTIFHRVISTFMIQGGGFTEELERKPTKPAIKNEANNNIKNLKGTLAMHRLSDPHSATAQFFINVQDNPAWNFTGEQNTITWGYAVFGKVLNGMDVVDKIRFIPTIAKKPFRKDVPIENIVINRISVVKEIPEITQPSS